MKRFSARKGLRQVSEAIQLEAVNDALRNSIWNVLHVDIWSSDGFLNWYHHEYEPRIIAFSQELWFHYFKKPIDTRNYDEKKILNEIRNYFFSCEWYDVYDFLEFVCQYHSKYPPHLVEHLNAILERELAGYRLVDGKVVDITDTEEVAMLDAALQDTMFEGVSAHLKRALELLADRKNPDYRNSIKESISAVESMARIVVQKDNATLGEALNTLEKKNKLHPALKQGFSKLYGYTSDENGIRHAMLEEPNITSADAKYFLLSCTSFVNYLKAQL